MTNNFLNIHLTTDKTPLSIPFNENTCAEDICITLCKEFAIGTIARHLFALRIYGKHVFLQPFAKVIDQRSTDYDFRIRFKPACLQRLKKIDIKAYDYYFHQVRTDVLDNKIPDLIFEKYRKELVGLGITDMYRVMLEKDIPREVVENDYKKYIPKEVIKRHAFFLKKPIHDNLGKIKKSGHDAWYVKSEYLKQLDIMAPEYLAEEYKAYIDKNGSVSHIVIRISPQSTDSNIKYCFESKRDKWYSICTFEELMYVSIRHDSTVEISRKNGIPYYLKFTSLDYMYSFVSVLDGYYRLAVKWIFNICKDVVTPSLQKLYAMKCHGPVGGEFSYAKLDAKRGNHPGCFILRESDVKYNVYYIDLCIKGSSKPKTFKLERISNDEFIFNDDFRTYTNINQLITAYSEPEGNIYLAECLPPSEYDQSPLLLCRTSNFVGEFLTETSALETAALGNPLIINNKDLQVYKSEKKEGSQGITLIYRGLWRVTKGKKIEVAMKVLKDEFRDKYYKEYCDLAGKWAFFQSLSIVRMYGIILSNQLSIISEYMKLGSLDNYLKLHKSQLKTVDLLEAASNLASALWHLEENGFVHGKIRCKNLFVNQHDENAFTIKLGDPGLHHTYSSNEVHWIPIECYSKLELTKRSPAADVWAFATTLWEIFTFAECSPPGDHTQAMKFYRNGQRLPQPPKCPNDVYQVMLECWDVDQYKRKKPQAIMRDISQIFYEMYNSRRTHSYAKIPVRHDDSLSTPSTSTVSLVSNNTESTCIGVLDDLVELSDSAEEFKSDFTFNGDDNSPCCDFQNFMSFDFSAISNSLDSLNSLQSVFELDNNCNVILQGKIGQGHYGDVYKGMLEYIPSNEEKPPRQVAVKKLKTNADSSTFYREIEIMKMLKHENIVEILGVFNEPDIMLIMEYVPHGSLETYLKIYKDRLSTKQLLSYSFDIAQGMDYLGKKNIVHRDLAARNILVVDDNHVKISDFGLAQVMEKNYYIIRTHRDLPIKWYAIESLREHKFSTKSDVWSYGVTLFEMFSLGEEPNLPVNSDNEKPIQGQEQQTLLKILESGIRLPCPTMCPQSIYVRILYPCWDKDPYSRPTFSQLGLIIDEMKRLET